MLFLSYLGLTLGLIISALLVKFAIALWRFRP